MTLNAIRGQWSTGIYVGGIPTTYIRNCVNSCDGCKNYSIWNETHNVLLEHLKETFDSLCRKHHVLRRRYKRRLYKNNIVTLYCCHRSGSKTQAHRKTTYVKAFKDKYGKRE